MSSQIYAVYTVSPRHLLSEARLAILEPCGQVGSASYTFEFFGVLAGRWHTPYTQYVAAGHLGALARLVPTV